MPYLVSSYTPQYQHHPLKYALKHDCNNQTPIGLIDNLPSKPSSISGVSMPLIRSCKLMLSPSSTYNVFSLANEKLSRFANALTLNKKHKINNLIQSLSSGGKINRFILRSL